MTASPSPPAAAARPRRWGRWLALIPVVTVAGSVALWRLWPTEGARPIRGRPAPAAPVPAGPRLRFDFGPDLSLGYRVTLRVESEAEMGFLMATVRARGAVKPPGGGPRQGQSLAFTGHLDLRLFRAGPDRWRAAARLAADRLTWNDRPPGWGRLADRLFAFSITARGVIDEVGHAQGTPEEVQTLQRAVLDRLRVTLSRRPVGAWTARERDAAGLYRARYTLRPGPRLVLAKRKLEYLEVASPTGGSPGRGAVFVARPGAQSTEIVLADGSRWIERVTGAESLTLSAAGRTWGSARVTAAVERAPSRSPLPATLAELDAALAAPPGDDGAYVTDPTLSREWGHLSLADAIAAFTALADRPRAERLMLNYLRLHPERSTTLVALLDASNRAGGKMNPTVRNTLWRLLATVGHREAQAALAGALGPERTLATRVQALGHVDLVEAPRRELTDALVAEYQRARPGDASGERQVKTMALLALGSLGHKGKAAAGVHEGTTATLARLLAAETDPGERVVVLKAIGNAGGDALLSAVRPTFDDPAPEVRAAAFEALRRMPDEAATRLFDSQYAREADPAVRRRALQVVERMEPSPAATRWAREALHDADPERQLVLVNLLGRGLGTDAANEAALRRLLASRPPRKVERAIYRYLPPTPRAPYSRSTR